MRSQRSSSPAEKLTLHELSAGAIWNPSLLPWYNVNMEIWREDAFAQEVLMVPTMLELKEVIRMQSHSLRITSIELVTPGSMNETGRWQIEVVDEISELLDASGLSIPRCKVEGKRTYRGFSLEPNDEGLTETLIYPRDLSKQHP